MNYVEKLTNLNLPADATVTLTYSDGCDVFVHNDTAIDDAIKETNTIRTFSDLVAHLAESSETTHWILEELRDNYVLDFEDEEDDDGDPIPTRLSSYEVSDGIRDLFGDQDFVRAEIKRYDYKRGFCDMVATLNISVEELLKTQPDLTGWEVEVETADGTLTFEV